MEVVVLPDDLACCVAEGHFPGGFFPYDSSRASRRCCSGGMLASTSILATRVQRSAPRHILTHSFCKTSNLLNVGSDPDPYTGDP